MKETTSLRPFIMSLPPNTYAAVLQSLLSHPHVFSSLPTSPHPTLIPSSNITSLSLHPTLESALHLLNADLPSAHFLLRHMQAQPAYEAMFLHGILHRIEGDYDNTRAWYGDVSDSDCFKHAWLGGIDEARKFVDRVEKWRKEGLKGYGGKEEYANATEELRRISLGEIRAVLAFCEKKFGKEEVKDASSVWIKMDQKHGEKAAEMITGGEGWRQF
jgi:hypothetical protein